jgi:signal transduction histidine kinase
LTTRIRLTVLYTGLSVIFLVAFSFVLYNSLFSRLAQSAQETILDQTVREAVLAKAEDIIKNLIFLGDSVVLVIVMVVGFFLTKKTLQPIQESMKKQNRFIADASHELRTPLAVMKTGIDISLRRKNLSSDDARKMLEGTLKEVNLLTALSNDLLSISKGHLSDITYEKIYLPDILQRKIERLKNIAERKNISLTLSGSAPKDKFIMGNDFMLSQAFYNLIHNALVYTPDGGEVRVSYGVRQNYFTVSIADTGIGIPKEALPHIFEPFYRVDNSDEANGSGLGLSIVKSHVEMHNGTVGARSEIGKGTVMTVSLPVIS